MKNIINIRVEEETDSSGMGTLYVSKKDDENSYTCYAVAILNADCCGVLKDMQGDYSKLKSTPRRKE